MKEAADLLKVIYDGGFDVRSPEMQRATARLALALELDPENCVIVRYEGFEKVYMIDEPTLDSEQDANIPAYVRQKGILLALREILEVPEAESILVVAVRKIRRLRQLHKEWCERLEESNQLNNRKEV
jgi:hypothetical protein